MSSHTGGGTPDVEVDRGGEPDDVGPAFEWVVEAGKVREFARACADVNFLEPGYIPLTFPEVATHFWEPDEFRVGSPHLNLSRLLHGEQEIEYARPLRVGDVLTGRTRLIKAYEKRGRRGGQMRFFIYETLFVDQNGGAVVRSLKTLLEVSAIPQ